MNLPSILVVIAHSDDETLFAGFLHSLKRRLHATIDPVCITNGENGFQHFGASAYLYDNLDLSNEKIDRQHLPGIQKQEMLNSARRIRIRKVFFYDQLDLKKEFDLDEVFRFQWDQEYIIEHPLRTIRTTNGAHGYDFMLIMLQNVVSHAHHTASGLLTLEAVERLQ